MDRQMMNAWLAEQAKKAQITEAQMQRKRLGINEDSMVQDVRVTRKNEPKVPGDIPEPADTQSAGTDSRSPGFSPGVSSDPNDVRKMDVIVGPAGYRPFAPNGPVFDPASARQKPKPQPYLKQSTGKYGTAKPYLITVSEATVRNTILGLPPQAELGLVPQAEARSKMGMYATKASSVLTPSDSKQNTDSNRMSLSKGEVGLNEQLNAEEEKYAKEHKSMLAGMIEQYGKEKGTRVFYATVRNKVRGK